MSTPSQIRRGRFVRITSLYSALIAVWLLSVLLGTSMMGIVEWTSSAALLIVILTSATIAFASSKLQRLARASARVLWVLGFIMFIHHAARAAEIDSVGVGPAQVASHMLILSLWVSAITSATLVLWRDHALRTRARC